AIAAAGADLLLFAGGDGTARDIHDAIGGAVPVLGVPAGVKMYSGVFARNAAAAGDAALDFLSAPGPGRLRAAEVVDVDEDADGPGRVRLYGELRVPAERSRLLAAKSRGAGDAEADLDRLAAAVVAEMEPGRLYLLGPGTTIGRIKERLGVDGGPLSVDAVLDRAAVGSGLGEAGLLALLDQHPRASALLGVVGGQGSLLGRGNQQLSAAVLRRLGADNLTVLAAADKLLTLQPQRLHVDTGDPEVDRMLSGYRRVRVAPGRTIVIEVGT
ncbi:MAG: NAD(+)/NADH kinase, partial [Actinobacteria bacterium]|nr:NAD(+)/NADH kinase [Actinomycetota bacterium]